MNGEICPSLWLLTTEFTFTFRERKFDHLKIFHSNFRNKIHNNTIKQLLRHIFSFWSWEWIVNSKILAYKFFSSAFIIIGNICSASSALISCMWHVRCQYLQWREDAVCIYCELCVWDGNSASSCVRLIRSIGAAIG